MTKEALIDTTIKRTEFLLRCNGINIRTGEVRRSDTLKSRFVYVLNFVWMNTDLAGAIVWFFVGLVNNKSFTELTYVAPCITFSFLANTKSLNLVICEKTIRNLIDNLRTLETDKRRHNPQCKQIVTAEHDFLNSVIKVSKVLNFLLMLGFALNPLALIALKYLATNTVELALPFLIIYPFDPFDIRYWPLVYVRQIWSGVIVTINICTTDYIFYIFCSYIRIQFRLLRRDIENMIPCNDENSNIINMENLKKQLVVLIKWHQQLIECTEILESVFTRSTLFNFISSSILICLTGFNVVAISDVAIVVTFASFLSMSLVQIFFLCFFGHQLMAASMEVSDAAYNCRWYTTDRIFAKSLLIMQTRAQVGCKLTASDFSKVDLKAFMKILSTAWSYFALLRTLYSSPREQI